MEQETKISRNELKTLFFPGRKLELTACLIKMPAPQPRTVKAIKSWGDEMERPDGRVSRLDILTGQQIYMVHAGLAPYQVRIKESDGELAAQYSLL